MIKPPFKTKKSEQTFERVLAVATQLFVERGYEKTTMRDISAASGLGLGALYYYFESKEGVVLSFYERINREVAAEYRQTKPPGNAAQGFVALMQIKLKALEPHRHLLRVIMKEAIDPESPLCPLNKAAHKPLDISVDVFESVAQLDGKPGKSDDGFTGRSLWMLHMAILGYWLHDRSPESAATRKAIESAGNLLTWSSRFAKIPGFSPLRKQVLSLVGNLFETGEEAAPTRPPEGKS